MLTRPLGKLPKAVSVIGFGGAAVSGASGGYGFGNISEEDAIALMREAIERGINLFDAAPVYGFGSAETRIGKALRGYGDEIWVISKGGITWNERKRIRLDNDPPVIRSMLEASLQRLGRDAIEIYMLHWPDAKVDIRRPMEVLADAKRAGKIRYIGLSNTNAADYDRASEVADIDVLQCEYSLFERSHEISTLVLAQENKIGVTTWGTLAKGILAGTVRSDDRKFEKTDARSFAPWWKNDNRTPKYQAMERIAGHLAKIGHTGIQLALAHSLGHPAVSSALCGPKSKAQLNLLLGALENLPSQADVEICRGLINQ